MEKLIMEIKQGRLSDHISSNYNQYSKEELVDVIKEMDYAIYRLLTEKETIEVRDQVANGLKEMYCETETLDELIRNIKKDNTLVVLDETGELNIDDINEDLDLFIEALETVTGREYTISHEVGKSVIKEYK